MKNCYLFLLAILPVWLFGQSKVQDPQTLDLLRNQINQSATSKAQSADLNDLIITDQNTSRQSGVKNTYVKQLNNGIEIYNGISSIHTKNNSTVIKVNDRFSYGLASKTKNVAPSISAVEAIQYVVADLGYSLTEKLQILDAPTGTDSKQLLSKGGISKQEIPAKLVYHKMEDGTLLLAWNVTIYENGGENWWNIRVDALSGELLEKDNMMVNCSHGKPNHVCSAKNHKVNHLADAHKADSPAKTTMVGGYRVFATPLSDPTDGARTLENNPDDATASPFGWHDTNGANGPEFTTTRGNNVHAYDAGNNQGYMPNGGANLVFDYPLDINADPNQYEDAGITNIFYWGNKNHDIFYQYGFDEVSGNFQENNYGNGGAGSDYVNINVQSSNNCNGSFGTPSDGNNPTMNMFICNGRDGAFNNTTTTHEYGHGVSRRLQAGPSNVSCQNNQEQMGEGWSDYLAMVLTIESTDNRNTVRAYGDWFYGNPNGIRPYRYTTDMAVNSSTYTNISGVSVPHGVGNVWASMLWEMTWDLIDQYGFDSDLYNGSGGNNISLQLVLEGLKLTPCLPGFVDSRDAILAADQALYGGANQCLIWGAFAKRGLGASANQGSSNSVSDGSQAFDLPSTCGGTGCTLTANPTSINFTSTGGSNTVAVTSSDAWTASDNASWVTLSPSSGSGNGSITVNAAANTSSATRSATITITCGSNTATVNITQNGAVIPCNRQYATVPYSTGFESGSLDQYWCSESENSFGRIQVTTANTPNSGSYHLTMDVTTNQNLNTNEATLGLNLQGLTSADLSFWWKEFSDENNAEDGVFLSDDGGGSYTKVYDLVGTSNAWQQINLDLAALASTNGLSLNNTFVVKFQQRDNYSISTDGFAFDDVSVTGSAPACTLAVSPSTLTFTAGSGTSSASITSSSAWTATDNAAWISLSPSSGSGNGTLNVNVTTNTSTNQRTGTVTVTCGSITRTIAVTQAGAQPPTNCTQQYTSLPYSTGFETGALDQYWCTATENAFGRIQVTSANTPNSGSNHLTMDVTTNANFNTNEATLGLRLAGLSTVDLSFYWKEFSDENHPEDGVFLSDDGGANYTKVYDLIGGTNVYQQINLDIDALASANGLSLTNTFVVKFQQRDNYSITTDGFAFDDVSVTGSSSACTLTVSPNSFNVIASGGTYTVGVTSTGAWTATDNASWLTINGGAGSGNGNFTFVTAQNTSTAARSATITISCGSVTRTVAVSQQGATPTGCTQQYATVPYSTGFESGALDQFWCSDTENNFGRVQVTSANGPRSGGNHLTMDVTTNTNFSTNEATLGLQLAGYTTANLNFWWKEFSDENHVEDGVFFSDDGGASYTLVYSLQNGPSAWTEVNLDIAALAAANGLSLTNTFLVKFQHRDNYSIATDGFAFDDISVTGNASGCSRQYANLPYSTGFENGSLDQYWCNDSENNFGRIQVTTANGPHSGTNHLTMDVTTNQNYCTNEASVGVRLAGQSNVTLSFWWKEFNDENNVEDGVFLSDDGGASYTKVYDLIGGSATWQSISLNISNLATANGLSLTNNFVVKFQQRDNYVISTDGFAFDDISITSGVPDNGEAPTTVFEEEIIQLEVTPVELSLNNYPNPFGDNTTFEYTLTEAANVEMIITDVTGKVVARPLVGVLRSSGTHTLGFDSQDLGNGVYLCTLIANKQRITKQILIAK